MEKEASKLPEGEVGGARVEFKSKQDFRVIRCLPGSSPARLLSGGSFGLSMHVQQRVIDYYMKEFGSAKTNKFVDTSRLEHERLKKLEHPNIVQSFGWFEEHCEGDLVHFSLKEFCSGGNLSDFLAGLAEPLPERHIQVWLNELCQAIRFLHDADYVHRDIRTKNILLSSPSPNNAPTLPTLKLSNFGQVESVDKLSQPNHADVLQHKPNFWPYAAPELWLFKPYSKKSDIWSLGIVSYELANRRLPFPAQDPGIIAEILFNQLEPFCDVQCGYSDLLKDLIMKLLQKDTKLRPDIGDVCSHQFMTVCFDSGEADVTEAATEQQVDIMPPEELVELEVAMQTSSAAKMPDTFEIVPDESCQDLTAPPPEIPTPSPSLKELDANDTADGAPVEISPDVVIQASENGDVELLRSALTKPNNNELIRQMISVTGEFSASHPLHTAARHGQTEVCKFLIEKLRIPADLPAPTSMSTSNSALNEAACYGQLDTVRYLVFDVFANVENRSLPSGRTPFLQACGKGHLEVVKLLAEEANCDIEAIEKLTQSPAIHLALDNGHFQVADYLLNIRPEFIEIRNGTNDLEQVPFGDYDLQGVDLVIDCKEQRRLNQNRTPLLQACYRGNLEAVEFLVKRGADLEARCNWANCHAKPIHLAATRGSLRCVEFLLQKEPELLDSTTLFGDTPLNIAAAEGHFKTVEYLVKQGADLEKTGMLHRTPLLSAASKGHFKIVRFLIENGANLKATDSNCFFHAQSNCLKSGVIHLAADGDHIHVISYLLDVEPKLNNAKDSAGSTALNRACSLGHLRTVKFLLSEKRKSKVENRGNLGRTPLLEAAANGHQEIVEFLVARRGADILAKDSASENTPLHMAIQYNHHGIAAYLADVAARRNELELMLAIQNAMGHNAMSYARMMNRHGVVELLECRGATF